MPDRRSRRPFFLRRLPLEHETVIYLFVSALDVFTTYLLLRSNELETRSEMVIESNPIARFFLDHWGMPGMIYYKFGMVGIVCLISQLIATRRLDTARKLLWFATVVVSGVVIYSLALFVRSH